MITFLEGAAVELFFQYARVGMKYCEDTVKNSHKRLIRHLTDPILSLAVSCFSVFAYCKC
jgi:hypothetical protein